MTWAEQLQQWRRRLDENPPDPALIAAAQRVGRLLAGGGS